MDADRVAQRALELHDKASMPLAEALALALREAAASPIWPCAKLVIRNGVVCVSSHQYAPGLPDGEHDVYPLPADSDARLADVDATAEPELCPACGSANYVTAWGKACADCAGKGGASLCCGFPVGGGCPDCPDSRNNPA